MVKCAKKFNWVDPDQSQKMLNGTGKKDGGIVCFAIGMPRLSMQQCLEIWLTVLSGLSCKLDVLFKRIDIDSYNETSIKSRSRERLTKIKKFLATQKNDWKSDHPPEKWKTFLSHPKKKHIYKNFKSWRRPCHSYYRHQLTLKRF